MNRLLHVIRNKYFIATCVFAVWMLFFDRYDISAQYEYVNQVKVLEKEKAFYESEINRINQSIRNLEGDFVEIEKIAREKYQMKRDGEDVYILIHEHN